MKLPFRLRFWTRMRRNWRTWWRKKGMIAGTAMIIIVPVLAGAGFAAYKQYMVAQYIAADYTQVLNTIAKGESNGNYNAYFGHANNTTLRFTDMSIAEVQKWQADFIAQGNPSSAVGKYQIISTTLDGLVQKLALDTNAKFDEAMQDRMAVALLERRGAQDYLQNKLTKQEFAHNLAKEWAALPKAVGTDPEQSYYAGDGLNKVRISLDEIYTALATLES